MGDVTAFAELTKAWRAGELAARDRLVALVYDEVRAIARRQLARHAEATLRPTELAHEALIRVLQQTGEWQSRRHLLNIIALATRQVLVDSARRRHAQKRDAGVAADLDSVVAEASAPSLDLDDSLEALAQADGRAAEVISLTYFGGLERIEIAELLGLSLSSVDRSLRFGRAWLKVALSDWTTQEPHG
jgi:RNA polymerase sigma factor (TIGR02999 family)